MEQFLLLLASLLYLLRLLSNTIVCIFYLGLKREILEIRISSSFYPMWWCMFYKEIMDAQHFSFYIILSNYVWSILFCQNRFHVVWRCIVVKDVSAKEKHNLIYWWPLGLSKFSDPFGLLAFPLYCLCCLYVGDDFRGAIIETKEASGKRIVMPRPHCISRRTKETKH